MPAYAIASGTNNAHTVNAAIRSKRIHPPQSYFGNQSAIGKYRWTAVFSSGGFNTI
jgi:hypothetical protein